MDIRLNGDNGANVCLKVNGYENPTAIDEADANWLNAIASFSVNGIDGAFAFPVTTYDLQRFADELLGILDRRMACAKLITDEEVLSIQIETKNGQLAAFGKIRITMEPRISVEFSFFTDLAQIRLLCENIKDVMATFSLKG